MDDQMYYTTAAQPDPTMNIVWFVLAVVALVGLWKMFQKAGKPGWAAIVPIYNVIVLLQIVGRPVWWLVLLFIPFVNLVVGIILSIDLAKAYGKGVGWGILAIFLPFVVYPYFGFSNDVKYVGKANAAPATT